ncbi:MAG: hypothetical protein MI702_04745 [Chlorobiales bacterium]|nr:hypothetical protein [Chlorobiales bacterium]
MLGRTYRGIVLGILLLFIFAFPAFAGHLPVQLMTEDAKKINPLTGQNADQPYSPQNSCGTCHNYHAITEGAHFQQDRNVRDDDYSEKKSDTMQK